MIMAYTYYAPADKNKDCSMSTNDNLYLKV